MRFGVLGAIEVCRDGEVLRLGGPKQRALLAFLMLHANRPVSRERLIDALWAERPPPRANATLDSYISRLRKLLGAERLIRETSGYRLVVEPGALDLDRFEELVRARRFGEALDVWRGPRSPTSSTSRSRTAPRRSSRNAGCSPSSSGSRPTSRRATASSWSPSSSDWCARTRCESG